jgi:hypothetical protein
MINVSQEEFNKLLEETVGAYHDMRDANAVLEQESKRLAEAEQRQLPRYGSVNVYNQHEKRATDANAAKQDAWEVFLKKRKEYLLVEVELRKAGMPARTWFKCGNWAIARCHLSSGHFPVIKLWAEVTERLGVEEARRHVEEWWG